VTNFNCFCVGSTLCGWPYVRQNVIIYNTILNKNVAFLFPDVKISTLSVCQYLSIVGLYLDEKSKFGQNFGLNLWS